MRLYAELTADIFICSSERIAHKYKGPVCNHRA
jgi:hypothetical protein